VISARYAVAVCVLAVAALVPTVIHSYVGVVVEDGKKAGSVPTTLVGYTSTPTERNAGWGQRRFDSNDWVERKYSNSNGTEDVILTVIRSYELTPLYHHPELAVAYYDGHSFEAARTRRFAGHDDVPVHVLRPDSADIAVAMYVLEYDGRYIDNPIAFQLRTSGALLFSGRRAMTLFFARTKAAPSERDLGTSGIGRLLLAAVDAFAGHTNDVARASTR
jgi:hypothetical protein